MKLNTIIKEGVLTEEQNIAEDAAYTIENIETMIEDIQEIRFIFENGELNKKQLASIQAVLEEIDELTDSEEISIIAEAVQRQFRRYGDKFVRQYRCITGPKAGRMVSSPEKCGLRKDPRRVRIGKRSARIKKGQRIRKTLFTKRKTQSKRLTRLNKVLRGEK